MNTVIYHSADYDGIFCREIARHFLGDKDTTYGGWKYGDEKIKPKEDQSKVYVLDLSPDCIDPSCLKMDSLIWIDHHKTSIDKWPTSIAGWRIDGVAACRLTYQWFKFAEEPTSTKQHFVGRIVEEPLAVRLAGEYDVWDRRNPDADTFQYGIKLVDIGSDFWEALLTIGDVGIKAVEDTLKNGYVAERYMKKQDASLVRNKSFRMRWEGLDFLCLNTGQFNSLTFAAKDTPDNGHDALLGFMWNGKVWTVSLYHAQHNTNVDLSVIAKKYDGGGHRGACGFTCNSLPFELK